MPDRQSSGRWYPTPDKLSKPEDIRAMLKEVLDRHYALADKFEAYKKANPPRTDEERKGPPPGSGPLDTQICGLFVQPIDTQALADGTKLTYVKSAGNFQFK